MLQFLQLVVQQQVYYSAIPSQCFVIELSDTGSLLAGSGDYQSLEMELVFGPSTSQHAVSIAITDDHVLEFDETLILRLSSASSSVTVDPSEATITIIDNDSK